MSANNSLSTEALGRSRWGGVSEQCDAPHYHPESKLRQGYGTSFLLARTDARQGEADAAADPGVRSPLAGYDPMTPVDVSTVHEVRQLMEAVVPLTLSGSQMYRESERLLEFQRSPR